MPQLLGHTKESVAAWGYIKKELLECIKHNEDLAETLPQVMGVTNWSKEQVIEKGAKICSTIIFSRKRSEIFTVALEESESLPEFIILYDSAMALLQKLEDKLR